MSAFRTPVLITLYKVLSDVVRRFQGVMLWTVSSPSDDVFQVVALALMTDDSVQDIFSGRCFLYGSDGFAGGVVGCRCRLTSLLGHAAAVAWWMNTVLCIPFSSIVIVWGRTLTILYGPWLRGNYL